MAGFHRQVKLSGYTFPMYQLTFNLKAGITKADEGKAVSLDTAAANTVKLAADGDVVLGRLEVVEDRTGTEGSLIGTVALHFAAKLPIKAGLAGDQVVAIGSRIVGAGAGEIRAADPTPAAEDLGQHAYPLVVDIVGTDAVVLKI